MLHLTVYPHAVDPFPMTDNPPEAITVRPHQGGWQVFEGEGVQPCFASREDAISYGQSRAAMRSIDIQVLGPTGAVEHVIRHAFSNR